MDNLHKPAYPEPCTADGYKATVDTGFTKLEAAALQIAGHMISVPDSWNVLKADRKEAGGWKFNRKKLAEQAVSVAKAILEECEKEQKQET